jgi:hypothetical protein
MNWLTVALLVTVFVQIGTQEVPPNTPPPAASEHGGVRKLNTHHEADKPHTTNPTSAPVASINHCVPCSPVEKPQAQSEADKAKAASLDRLTRRYMWATMFGVIGAWVGLIILITQTLISRYTAQRQLRAYVFTETADILEGSMFTPPLPARTNFPWVHMTIKNSGQTPAYDIISWLQIAITMPANEGTLVVIPPIQRVSANNLGPGGTFAKNLWHDRPVTAPEIADIARSAGYLPLWEDRVYGRL